MKAAGKIVLGGFELRTDAKIVRYPDRYMDERGRAFFERVLELLDGLDSDKTLVPVLPLPLAPGQGDL